MKECVEMGWRRNVLKMEIESDLYRGEMRKKKVKNLRRRVGGGEREVGN